MSAQLDLIRRCYAAFNARDLDAALDDVHADIDWPNAIDGGPVRGHVGDPRRLCRRLEGGSFSYVAW